MCFYHDDLYLVCLTFACVWFCTDVRPAQPLPQSQDNYSLAGQVDEAPAPFTPKDHITFENPHSGHTSITSSNSDAYVPPDNEYLPPTNPDYTNHSDASQHVNYQNPGVVNPNNYPTSGNVNQGNYQNQNHPSTSVQPSSAQSYPHRQNQSPPLQNQRGQSLDQPQSHTPVDDSYLNPNPALEADPTMNTPEVPQQQGRPTSENYLPLLDEEYTNVPPEGVVNTCFVEGESSTDKEYIQPNGEMENSVSTSSPVPHVKKDGYLTAIN